MYPKTHSVTGGCIERRTAVEDYTDSSGAEVWPLNIHCDVSSKAMIP